MNLKSILSLEDVSTLNPLEKALWTYFKTGKVISLGYSDLKEGIQSFGLEALEFWQSSFSLDNLDLFLKEEDFKEQATNWFFDQKESEHIGGSLVLKNQEFIAEDTRLGKILSLIKPVVIEEEISELKSNLTLLEDSLDKKVQVKLVLRDLGYELLLDSKKEEKSPSALQKCLTLMSIPLFGAIVFTSPASMAQSKESVLQDNIKQTQIYKDVEQIAKGLEEKTKQTIKESGLELPAGALAVGVKAGIERKIDFTGSSEIIPVNYEMSVGFDESIVKLNTKAKILKEKVDTWIKGTHNGEGQKVEIGLHYSF